MVQQLQYLIELDSQMCHFGRISGSLLLFWGSHSIVLYLIFLEGDPKLSGKLEGAFCATWYGGSIRIFPEVFALVDGLPCPSGYYCLTKFFWNYLIPLVPFWNGGLKFSEVLICNSEKGLRKYSTYLKVSLSLYKEGISWGSLPLSLAGFILLPFS